MKIIELNIIQVILIAESENVFDIFIRLSLIIFQKLKILIAIHFI